jgi:hypothetical protein
MKYKRPIAMHPKDPIRLNAPKWDNHAADESVRWWVDWKLFEQEGEGKHDDNRELMPLLYTATKFVPLMWQIKTSDFSLCWTKIYVEIEKPWSGLLFAVRLILAPPCKPS